jgi:hypothetical protein
MCRDGGVIGCGAEGDGRAVVDRSAAAERDDRGNRAARAPRVSRHSPQHNFNVQEPKVDPDRTRTPLRRDAEGKFDAFTSVPLDPWVKGAAMLYSRAFFEESSAPESGRCRDAVRAALREQPAAVKSEIATSSKPSEGMVFATHNWDGYDVCCSGRWSRRR